MSTGIKYYADEHIPKAVIRGLCNRGIDVLSIPESGLLGASDDVHLEKARDENRVIITQDDDFLRLHASGKEHSGIVYAPQGASIGEMITGLMLVYHVLDASDMENHIEYL
jgi:hypothetical protein